MVVLIATASAPDLAALRRILGPGAEIRWAESGKEAIRMLSGAPVPVVLCDAELPDGDWRLVLQQAEGSPVVVFSRFADEGLWSEVLHFGAYDAAVPRGRSAAGDGRCRAIRIGPAFCALAGQASVSADPQV